MSGSNQGAREPAPDPAGAAANPGTDPEACPVCAAGQPAQDPAPARTGGQDAPAGADDTPLAYRNEAFLDSDDARPLRILAEYLQPLHAFHRERVCGTVVFFGSARIAADGPLGRYYAEARELARLVTRWSMGLSAHKCHSVVCTGGGGGIMEAANRGAADAGGKSIGLNIGLPHEQQPNAWITAALRFEFHYFFMRKLWFAHLARALVVFPGGFGTLDELTEILTLMQTRKIARRIPVVMYGTSYWNEILDFDALVRHGMIDRADLSLFRFADDPATALDIITHGAEPADETRLPDLAASRIAR